MQTNNNIKSRVLKTELINWRELRFIQGDSFKDLDENAKHKLKASIVANDFTQPFYIWEDPDQVRWCLDGKHRTLLLQELIAEGVSVPYELPATFIHCEDRKEAARLVLIYSSVYAKITQEGMFEFLQENNLEYADLKEQINLPEFSELKFEQKFDSIEDEKIEEETVEVADADLIVKSGDMFMVGKHMLYCGNFQDRDQVEGMLNGRLARVVFTDPPYNLKTDAFSNNGSVEHADFAMASGEMSDEEFSMFLAQVMKESILNSIDGAIHYICMDWRHAWHMSQASKEMYGSVEPKNLIVWNKNNAGMGSFYRSKHEFIYVFKAGEDPHVSNINLGDRYRTNVWEYPISTSFNNEDKEELKNHPTPKPVKMVADALLDASNEGELVIDWFVGSGTTLIAAEITNRASVCVDIEPKFIQSTIKRYINQCRKLSRDPHLVHMNGNLTLETFS